MRTYYVERDDDETITVKAENARRAAVAAADLMPARDAIAVVGQHGLRASSRSTFRVFLLDEFDLFRVAVEAA